MDSLSPTPEEPRDGTDPADDTPDTRPAIPFEPATPRAMHNGWTAARQRNFVETLAETGCVREAAAAAGMSARSAYRLRARPDGTDFARAWDAALHLAASRLVALAFDRVTNGLREEVWKDGELVGTRIRPSERLHVFLLTHLAPMQFGKLSGMLPAAVPDPVDTAREALAACADTLADVSPDAVAPDPLPFDDPAVIDWRDAPLA